MAEFEGQLTPGGGAKYWVSDAAVAGGNGKVPGTHLFVTVAGVPTQLDLATGIYLPTQMVVSDTTGAPVQIGDPTNNAARVNVVGGAAVTQFHIDSSPFTRGVDGGVPSLYATGTPPAVPLGAAAAARMSLDGVVFTTTPPRESIVQGWTSLTTSAEVIILPAGGAGVFHDLTGIWIYSNTTASRFTIFLRDTNGGDIKFPIAIAAGGGQVNPLSKPFNATIPASVWTAQLNINPAPDLVYVILQAEKRTAN